MMTAAWYKNDTNY